MPSSYCANPAREITRVAHEGATSPTETVVTTMFQVKRIISAVNINKVQAAAASDAEPAMLSPAVPADQPGSFGFDPDSDRNQIQEETTRDTVQATRVQRVRLVINEPIENDWYRPRDRSNAFVRATGHAHHRMAPFPFAIDTIDTGRMARLFTPCSAGHSPSHFPDGPGSPEHGRSLRCRVCQHRDGHHWQWRR